MLLLAPAWSDEDPAAELHARRVAALAALGHEVDVAVGSPGGAELDAVDAAGARRVELAPGLARLERADRWTDHWQKGASPAIARLVRELLRAEGHRLVHVAGWARLARDLVHAAALEGVPAVVELRDAWTSCLLATRVRPSDGAACDADLGAHPCLACAESVPPGAPWVPLEQRHMHFAKRRAEIERELRLARARLAPSPELAALPARHLGLDLSVQVLPDPPLGDRAALEAHVAALAAVWERALAAGPPEVAAPADDWYAERMAAFEAAAWDRARAEHAD